MPRIDPANYVFPLPALLTSVSLYTPAHWGDCRAGGERKGFLFCFLPRFGFCFLLWWQKGCCMRGMGLLAMPVALGCPKGSPHPLLRPPAMGGVFLQQSHRLLTREIQTSNSPPCRPSSKFLKSSLFTFATGMKEALLVLVALLPEVILS